MFEQELIRLFTEATEDGVTDIFKHDSGTHPFILKAFMRNSIGPETLVIMDRITGFTDQLSIPDTDPVWPGIRRLIRKYRPFLKINLDKFTEIYHGCIRT